MDLLAISRTVVSTSLKIVRLPVEQALKLATGSNGAADEDSVRATSTSTRKRQADERKPQAERRRAAGRRQAQQKRSQASRRAQSERPAADEQRRTRERRAEETTEKREAEAREAAEKTQAQVAAREQRANLEQLHSAAQAVEKHDDALTPTDEANRLKAATEKAKEARRDE